jgi:hypothetical protein
LTSRNRRSLLFEAGIDLANLTLAEVNGDLQLRVSPNGTPTPDQVTVSGWFSHRTGRIESVQLGE